MLETLDDDEYLLQLAYNELHPPERQDYLFAMLAQITANVWRDSKTSAYPITDFLFPWGQTDEDRAKIEAMKARTWFLANKKAK